MKIISYPPSSADEGWHSWTSVHTIRPNHIPTTTSDQSDQSASFPGSPLPSRAQNLNRQSTFTHRPQRILSSPSKRNESERMVERQRSGRRNRSERPKQRAAQLNARAKPVCETAPLIVGSYSRRQRGNSRPAGPQLGCARSDPLLSLGSVEAHAPNRRADFQWPSPAIRRTVAAQQRATTHGAGNVA